MVNTTQGVSTKIFKIGGRKWIVPSVAALLMVLLIVPVAHAGILWSGIDPIFKVNDHKFNVYIEGPSEYTCSITRAIKIKVKVPVNADYQFISESSGDIGNCGNNIFTKTTEVDVVKDGYEKIRVVTRVRSDEVVPIRVKVYHDDELVRIYEGQSNSPVKGKAIRLSELDDHEDDD